MEKVHSPSCLVAINFCPDWTKHAVQEKGKVKDKQLQCKMAVMICLITTTTTTTEQKFISLPDKAYLSEIASYFSLILVKI